MLEDKEHWEDVGYEIVKGTMKRGELVEVTRPEQNSPTQLVSPRGTPLVHWQGINTLDEEVAYCASVFQEFIDGGLQPHDLMAIAVDDRAARTYLSELSEELANRGIPSNNIIADRYSEPSFLIEGKCTLTTVHRAKGNESAVVVVLGNDAVPLESRSGRNRLFTAFTRTKGWLRVTGMGNGFAPLRREIERAMSLAPSMSFIMEDPARIEMIQRDLSERDARILRAQAEMERLKDELGVTDEELAEELNKKNKSRKDAKK